VELKICILMQQIRSEVKYFVHPHILWLEEDLISWAEAVTKGLCIRWEREQTVLLGAVPPLPSSPVTVTCHGPEYTLRSEGEDNKAPNLAEHECEIVLAVEVGEDICKLTL